LFWGNGLPTNDHVSLAKKSDESGWCNTEFRGERSGASACFVAPDNIFNLFSAEPRRESMDMELPGLGRITSCALGDSHFPQSIRG
jgi:hypothetical protein